MRRRSRVCAEKGICAYSRISFRTSRIWRGTSADEDGRQTVRRKGRTQGSDMGSLFPQMVQFGLLPDRSRSGGSSSAVRRKQGARRRGSYDTVVSDLLRTCLSGARRADPSRKVRSEKGGKTMDRYVAYFPDNSLRRGSLSVPLCLRQQNPLQTAG